MDERYYQRKLIKKIKDKFPGAYVLKNDASYKQAIPDLTVLYRDRWAMLEVKKNEKATHRPNQDRKVNELNSMSFAAFIYPENEQEVLDAMEQALRSRRRKSCNSKSK